MNGLSVLITGGAGSLGRELVRQLLSLPEVRRLVIFSRDEAKHHDMRTVGFTDERLRYFIGDVRNVDRLRLAFRNVDWVIHCAALKEVDAGEADPVEFKLTNVDGACNIIQAALWSDVRRVIALSTDKCVASYTAYGASKFLAEKLFIQSNSYTSDAGVRFSCVRYGNVLGSRGSVVPLWRQQAKAGKITVTDPQMTRFFLTLPQAAAFVWSCLQAMTGGEVFIPKIPSAYLHTLAEAVAPEAERVSIPIRLAEKTHEVLVSPEESANAYDLGDRYALLPSLPWWAPKIPAGAVKMPAGWSYTSDNNPCWLTVEKLRAMIDGNEH